MIAQGALTVTSGEFSFASGYENTASGDYSFAMGRQSNATGSYTMPTVAMGRSSNATAFSTNCDATGYASGFTLLTLVQILLQFSLGLFNTNLNSSA